MNDIDQPHIHRQASKDDFEGKTVARFEPDADNVWRFWFSDGTAFAIQCESSNGIPYMEICDVCVDDNDLDREINMPLEAAMEAAEGH